MKIQDVRNEAARLGFFNDSVESLIKTVKSNLINIFKKDTEIYYERNKQNVKKLIEFKLEEETYLKILSSKILKQSDILFSLAGVFFIAFISLFGLELSFLMVLVFCGLSICGGILKIYKKIESAFWKPILFTALSITGWLTYLSISLDNNKTIFQSILLSTVLAISIYIINEIFPKCVNSIGFSAKYLHRRLTLIQLRKSIKQVESQIKQDTNSLRTKEEELKRLVDYNIKTINYEYELGVLAKNCSDTLPMINHIKSNNTQEVNYA
ncbi:hypothetical protein ACFL5D_05255 [Candidatus Neomarinimicrobiota bacterium]